MVVSGSGTVYDPKRPTPHNQLGTAGPRVDAAKTMTTAPQSADGKLPSITPGALLAVGLQCFAELLAPSLHGVKALTEAATPPLTLSFVMYDKLRVIRFYTARFAAFASADVPRSENDIWPNE